jgi:hypothetical protein
MSDKSEADFLQDQLDALLASPVLVRVAERHSEGSDDPAEFDESLGERDTEPNIDVQMLRDALRVGLKQ